MAERRRWPLIVGGLLLVGLVVVGWSQVREGLATIGDTVASWSTRLRDLSADQPRTEVGLRSLEGESTNVLVVLGSEEADAAFLMLANAPDDPPVALVLPQDLLAAVPGFGEFRLVDALVFGGPELVALSVTNQFGIRIDEVAALPAGSIRDGLVGPVTVDLSVPLFVEESDGSNSRVLDAGSNEITPELVERLLVEPGVGDPFDWIQRQGSAWRSVLDVVVQEPRVADRLTVLAGPSGAAAADMLVTTAGDEESVLATVPVSRAVSVTGVDAFVPAPDQAVDFMRTRFDHLLLRPTGRPRIEILNGNGRIGTTGDIAGILIRDGFRVVRTDNADHFDHDDTQVIAQGDHAEGWAREILDLIGRGLLFREVRAPSGVVDVSIIVGHDIPAGEG